MQKWRTASVGKLYKGSTGNETLQVLIAILQARINIYNLGLIVTKPKDY